MNTSSLSLSTKAIIVTRRTRLEELIAQYNTEAQAAFVIQSKGGDVKELQIEHKTYYRALATVETALKEKARLQKIERNFLPNLIFGPEDIIIVVGQDGLVANTLKYLTGQPVIAINPDPTRCDGVLLPFVADDIASVFSDAVNQHYQSKTITMAKAVLNDGQTLIAVNDIFIGPRSHTSARYTLSLEKHTEVQCSSGIIVSTGLGSTGWMKSILAGAAGITGNRNPPTAKPLAWDSNTLRYAVREPFPSKRDCGESGESFGLNKCL